MFQEWKCMKWTIPMVKSWNCIARGAPQWDTSCASENANRTRRGRGGFPRSKSEERQKGASAHWKTAETPRVSWQVKNRPSTICKTYNARPWCWHDMGLWKWAQPQVSPGFLHRNSTENFHRRFHLLPSLAAWVQRRSSFVSSDPKNARSGIWYHIQTLAYHMYHHFPFYNCHLSGYPIDTPCNVIPTSSLLRSSKWAPRARAEPLHSAVLHSSARFCPENGCARLKQSHFFLAKKKFGSTFYEHVFGLFFQDNHANLGRIGGCIFRDGWRLNRSKPSHFQDKILNFWLRTLSDQLLDALQIAVQAIELGDRRLIQGWVSWNGAILGFFSPPNCAWNLDCSQFPLFFDSMLAGDPRSLLSIHLWWFNPKFCWLNPNYPQFLLKPWHPLLKIHKFCALQRCIIARRFRLVQVAELWSHIWDIFGKSSKENGDFGDFMGYNYII